MSDLPVYSEVPAQPLHDFWLLSEGERTYQDYWDLIKRKDAPVRIPDSTLGTLSTGLQWTPTLNPSNPSAWPGYELNQFGPTVITQEGAAIWSQVMRGWAQIFQSGPKTLRLPAGIIYVHPGKTQSETRTIKSGDGGRMLFQNVDNAPRPHHHILLVERDAFVADLHTLAEWGDKAATGEYFILHLGI